MFIRHIKAYKWIRFIPIGHKYRFISYIWENGIWKSSILEAMDSFFNNKLYPLNKWAISDGIYTIWNDPFIAPIFLVEKTKINKKVKEFSKLSDFFWNIQKEDLDVNIKKSTKDFFDLRDEIIDKKDTHYLFIIWEQNIFNTTAPKVYFGSFINDEKFLTFVLDKDINEIDWKIWEDKKNIILGWQNELSKNYKEVLTEIKDLYFYVYLPVEIDIESFTKIETDEMQKIFDKKLKDEIKDALNWVNLDWAWWINKKLKDFILNIEWILEQQYSYETWMQRNNTLTKWDIVEKILEVYFQKRILTKIENDWTKKKISELSAWEKRQALIDLVYAFLKTENPREKDLIIGIDEPENSLHTSLCYEQFEKLKDISNNNQIFITTHWYWFLPITSEWLWHFITEWKSGTIFETYDLYDYRAKIKSDIVINKNKIPNDFILKSTNDLVQSIYYSLKWEKSYNWLICEWISEKIYFEYFFKDLIIDKKLKILPMWSFKKVSELYEYLELPIKNKDEDIKWKVFCLIDTDLNRHKDNLSEWYVNLKIRRLSNEKNTNIKTELLTLNNSDTTQTDIEQSLNPIIFKETIEKLEVKSEYLITTIENNNWNTNFIKNLKNLEIENYFQENEWENKIIFAHKYIEVLESKEKENYNLPWIEEIKTFFNS